jgi:hypothetical protein
MKSLTGGALLLVLGVPLALYAALAVKSVARADLVGGDPPADRGANKDALAKARAGAASWLGEVRKATTVAGQYRTASAEDDSREPPVSAAIRAASNRAQNLSNADQFLSNIPNPKFEGPLAETFNTLHAGRAKLPDDERAVRAWLDNKPAIKSAGDAKRAMLRANELISQYSGRTQFADAAKAAKWRAEARLYVATALAKHTDEQYAATMKIPLPLAPSDSVATRDALDTLAEQVRELEKEASAAATAGGPLERAEFDEVERLKPVRKEIDARKNLLDVFAQENLFETPDGAAQWLQRVSAQYRGTTEVGTRELIRTKVQEFCEVFLAPAARLDDDVLFKGKAVPRAQVQVKYRPRPGAVAEFDKLSNAPNGLNEFTAAKQFPGEGTYFVYKGNDEYLKDFEATDVSKAAVAYNAARAKVAGPPGRAKWTANSLAELKKACEDQKELLDQLKVGNSVPQLRKRLDGLTEGARSNPHLFGDQ